jgi:D-alanyl-D-alanine carboxypeptidase
MQWSPYFSLEFLGINYGRGILQFQTIPILMPSKYRLTGNIGSTGAFLFFHPEDDLLIMGTVIQFGSVRPAVQIAMRAVDEILELDRAE